jgi:cysteine desulfuration protein SufE
VICGQCLSWVKAEKLALTTLSALPPIADMAGNDYESSPCIAFDRPRPYIWLRNQTRDTMTTIDEIRDNFALLDDWDDRYRYVIELGRTLDPMPEAEHSAANKVQGCASQVWLSKQIDRSKSDQPHLNYLGDSDAHIVRGLIAILLTLFSGHTPQQILSTDAIAVFDEFGFREHLTPQRSNGLRAMVERIRADAREALAPAS